MASYATGLGRTIDPRNPSNLFAMVATLAGGAIAFFPALGDGFWEAVGDGVLTGGAAFLAWAVTREIDPDRPIAAGVAAVAAIAASFAGEPGLAVSAAALLAARILVRSTGLVPTMADVLVVGGAAIYIATRPAGLPAAVVIGLAFLADGRLPGRSANHTTIGGDVIVVAAIVSGIVAGTLVPEFVAPSGVEWVLLGVAAFGAILVVRPPVTTSKTDWTDEPIDGRRLRTARTAVLAIVALAFVWAGAVGLGAAAPAAIAMVVALLPLPQWRTVGAPA